MARTPNIAKVKKTLMDTASATQETVGQVVGKARDTVEAISPVGLPKRGRAARKKAPAPLEPLEPQSAPRKNQGDALAIPKDSSSTTAKKASAKTAKQSPAKKSPAKKAAAKKTATKKSTAKKSAAKKAPAKKAAKKS